MQLMRWMLEHGNPGATAFLSQLADATVTPWRCACGCASIHFSIRGRAEPHGGLKPLADFIFGSESDLSGIFVYEQQGVLSGLEVYGLAGEAPKSLPAMELLKPFPRPAA
jgi:hypothetical protein